MSDFIDTITIITDSDLISYYSSFFVEDGLLIIYGDTKYLYTDMRYYNAAINHATANCRLIDTNSVSNFINENSIKKVGLVYEYTPISFLSSIENLGVEIFDVTETVYNQMAIKTDREIDLIKCSCQILELSLSQAVSELKEGITERQFQAKLEYLFKLNGGDKAAFDSIVAFGEGSAIPHYKTGDVILKKDMPVLIDCGVCKNNYRSDITRSFYFGTAPSEYIKAHKAVLDAHNKAFLEITAGMTGAEADKIARDYLKTQGYAEYFTHSLGHGVGVKIHENPRLSKTSTYNLKNGNVFSVEPGVYIAGKFGIRIEDTVYLSGGKCHSFFQISKNEYEINS